VNASIPASAKVRAALQPGDALAEDDEIVLDLGRCTGAGWRPMRSVPRRSGPPLPHTLPLLVEQGATDVEPCWTAVRVARSGGVASIRVLANRTPSRPRGSVQWSSAVPESRRVRLDAEQLQVAARLEARPGDVRLARRRRRASDRQSRRRVAASRDITGFQARRRRCAVGDPLLVN
jgi:hypothetical protein